MLKFAVIISVLGLISCTTVQKTPDRSVSIAREVSIQLQEPQDILPSIQLVQYLTIQHGEKKNSSQVVLTSKDNRLSLVALLPFGGEVFRVEYTNKEITSKALPLTVPKDFDLKYALADVILIYADKEKLNHWLSLGAIVQDQDLTRTVYYKSEPLIKIRYDKPDKFAAAIEYEHLQRQYKILIQPISKGQP